jgi:hypothetical protein
VKGKKTGRDNRGGKRSRAGDWWTRISYLIKQEIEDKNDIMRRIDVIDEHMCKYQNDIEKQ